MFIALICYVGVKLAKQRFNQSTTVFGVLRAKQERTFDAFSVPKQYGEIKHQCILHFEVKSKRLSLYASESLYHSIDMGDSGMISHNNKRCIHFENKTR